MSESSRSLDDLRTFLNSTTGLDLQQRMKFYDSWAETYEMVSGQKLILLQMVKLGFKHFVGVDGSQGMLDQAAKTGLYKELKLALLGTEPLPAQTGTFDVVMIVGALRDGFVPISVIRELCLAAKPGGYICMSRNGIKSESGNKHKVSMEKELQLMEDEELWSHVITKEMDKYMIDVYDNSEDVQNEKYLYGTMYLYRRSLN